MLRRPIKVLKLAVSFFFELFYISTLGIFVIALDCTYYNPVKVNEVREPTCLTPAGNSFRDPFLRASRVASQQLLAV